MVNNFDDVIYFPITLIQFFTITDLVVGAGAEAIAGAVVDVHYVGVEYEGDKHTEFDGVRLTKELLERVRAELSAS